MSKWPLAGALLLAGLCGCSAPSRLALTSYQDPHAPERYEVVFDRCAMVRSANGDIHVAADRLTPPGLDNAEPVRQMLWAHVFWRPRAGRTTDDPTAVDAVIRYVVASPSGAAAYSGTGFIYLDKRWGGVTRARVESGRLRLVRQEGEMADVLGEVELVGVLHAPADAALAAELRRDVRQHLPAGR